MARESKGTFCLYTLSSTVETASLYAFLDNPP